MCIHAAEPARSQRGGIETQHRCGPPLLAENCVAGPDTSWPGPDQEAAQPATQLGARTSRRPSRHHPQANRRQPPLSTSVFPASQSAESETTRTFASDRSSSKKWQAGGLPATGQEVEALSQVCTAKRRLKVHYILVAHLFGNDGEGLGRRQTRSCAVSRTQPGSTSRLARTRRATGSSPLDQFSNVIPCGILDCENDRT